MTLVRITIEIRVRRNIDGITIITTQQHAIRRSINYGIVPTISPSIPHEECMNKNNVFISYTVYPQNIHQPLSNMLVVGLSPLL